jgi:hypothetical protein
MIRCLGYESTRRAANFWPGMGKLRLVDDLRQQNLHERA